MDQEHGADKDYVLFIINVNLGQIGVLVIFCRLAGGLRHWDVNLGLNGFLLITRILYCKVELDEFFAVLRAALHWLRRQILIFRLIDMENASGLLSEAAEALERRLLFIFLLLRED